MSVSSEIIYMSEDSRMRRADDVGVKGVDTGPNSSGHGKGRIQNAEGLGWRARSKYSNRSEETQETVYLRDGLDFLNKAEVLF